VLFHFLLDEWQSMEICNKFNKMFFSVLPIGDILANLIATFAAFGHHSLFWPKATTIERSQIAALDWQRWFFYSVQPKLS